MFRPMLLPALAIAALVSAAAPAQQPAPPPAISPADLEALRVARATMPDNPGSGPYPAIKEVDPTLPDHVVYRPADLTALGRRKLGVVAWGNGGCQDDAASARLHLAEIASYGYLVIAPGRILTGPGAPPEAPGQAPPSGRILPPRTFSADVAHGIDWALAENRRAGSRYHGLIDARAIAVAGHSCGGLQAIEVGADPRVRTVLVHNSGIFINDNPIRGLTVNKAMLRRLHTPVVYILGGPTDIAYPNGTDDFRLIDHVPAMLLNLPVGHGGTFWAPGGGAVAQVAVDWLEWQLRGDKTAARTFVGPNCRLCNGTQWTIERKNWP